MDYFNYKEGLAHCEDVSLAQLANEFGTPLYVYSLATLQRHVTRLLEAFSGYPTTACFAVKSNSNLSILKEVFRLGCGADLVSIGELKRSLIAGVDPQKIVFSGVGKRPDEIAAGLDADILAFNVESSFEIDAITEVATKVGKKARVALRINPNIDAKTNPKIATGLHTTKFGLVEDEAWELARKLRQSDAVDLVGIACHIGSQITTVEPLQMAAERMADLAERLKAAGHPLQFIDMGGGLGIRYRNENPPNLGDYAAALIEPIRKTGLSLIIEPGRVLMGNVGIVLTQVIGVKQTPAKSFVVVDAAMNDLLRPSMYDSYHDILPAQQSTGEDDVIIADVVGPICESADFLGKDRKLPRPKTGDYIYIRGCGAYASAMASQYNSRPRAAEVLVNGPECRLIRRRESLEEIWRSEQELLK